VGEHPLQLYSLGTPNGMKVTILLEELGVEYDAWLINIMEQDQFKSGFVEINPNSKIPAMADHDFVPPLNIWESGHILKYLAEKYDKFIPKEPRERVECFNWLFWLQASAPFIGGGFGHFYKYAPLHIEYAVDRYTMETKRLLDVLDKHLEGRDFICNEYSIADMAIMPWILCIYKFYNAADFLDYQSYKNVVAWVARIEERPAVQRGLRVNTFGPDAVTERHSPADFETKAE
jgi:GST-like protein